MLHGVVLDPGGNPLEGAAVVADGLDGDINQVTLRTTSVSNGRFRLPVPHGRYRLYAGHGNADWLSPIGPTIYSSPGGTHAARVLKFRLPDAVLRGTASIAGDPLVEGRVHFWAFSSDGAATQTTGDLGGVYNLDVIGNTTWFVGAVLEINSSFYGTHESIRLGPGNGTLDLVLGGPFPEPSLVEISFDSTQPQSLHLAEPHLKPAYFSTSTQTWTIPDS